MENNIILFDQIKNHKWDKFKDLIKKNKDINVNIRDSNFNYLIQYAIMFNKKDITLYLIENGSKLDIIDADGRSILFNPIKFNYLEILELLLRYNDKIIGVSLVDIQDNSGNTALHYSVIFDNSKAFDLLIKSDSNINIKDDNNDDSLHLAVLYKRERMLEKILQISNININSVNDLGETALHYAAKNGLNKIAKMLIDAQININFQNYEKKLTALAYCVNLDYNVLAKMLIPISDLNLQDISGNTITHTSIYLKNLEIINILIKQDLNFNLVNIEGNTIFHSLLISLPKINDTNLIEILIRNTDLNIQNSDGNTCLHLLFENDIWHDYLDLISQKRNKYFIKNNRNKVILDYFEKDSNEYKKLINLIVNGYYNSLQIENKKWTNQWENLCKKNSDNLNTLKEILKSKESNQELICKNKIKEYVLKNKSSLPISSEYKKIVIDSGIFVDKCSYTGSALDVLMGNIFLMNKYDNIKTILTDDFIDNEKIDNYFESVGENSGFKIEFLNFEIMWVYQKLFYPTHFNQTVNTILSDSRINFIIISLAIELSNGSHANILIWDIKNKVISRFEPHGASNPSQLNYNENLLDDLLKNKFTCFDNTLSYLKPKDFLPNIGFQKFEMMENEKCTRIGDPNGFCAVWCVWWCDMRLKYPEIKESKLVIKLMNKIREDGISFKDLIRNYSKNITDIRDKTLKRINIDINDWYNDKYSDEQGEQLIIEIKRLIK